MERQSREIWRKRVARWQDSNLSANEFAAELGVNPRTLVYWKWKLGSEVRGGKTAPAVAVSTPAFVEVTPATRPAGSTEVFELVLAGLTVRVPPRFDADTLKRLLEVVRA